MNHETTQHTTHQHGSDPGGSVRDPVCGMNVDPNSASQSDSFAGQTYFFCSQQCLAKFRSEPGLYVDERPAPADDMKTSSATAAGEYTCPMHPEVRQQGPGACPKCGMALEPVAPLAVGRAEYVCPMHPEIVRKEPGNCPICGMALEPKVASAGEEANPELVEMKRRFWVSLVLTVPVLIAAMGEMIPGQPLQHLASQRTWTWVEFLLGSPVVLWGGWPFFVRGGVPF